MQHFPLYFYVAGTAVVRRSPLVKLVRAFAAAKEFESNRLDDLPDKHPWHKKYGVATRTHQAWNVPVLEGASIPPFCGKPSEHAILLMFLFRPWRALSVGWFANGLSDNAICESYCAWRAHVRTLAQEAVTCKVLAFGTDMW